MQILITVDNERPPEIQLSDVAQQVQDALGSAVSVRPFANLSSLLVTFAGVAEVNDVRAKVKAINPFIRDIMIDEPLVNIGPSIAGRH